MTFERSWALLLLILPIAWLAWEWRRQSHRTALLLKAAMAAAVILALSEPTLSIRDRKVALAVLADTSASVSDADLARENRILSQLDNARGSNELDVIPFARVARPLDASEENGKLARTKGEAGRATNLEAPIRQALASLPAGQDPSHRADYRWQRKRRVGNSRRLAGPAARHPGGYHRAGRAENNPNSTPKPWEFPALYSPANDSPSISRFSLRRATQATVELSAEGKQIGLHKIALAAGENRIRIRTSLNAAGAIDLSGKIEAPGLGESRFENALSVRRPKVQWISEDPPGTEGHIVDVLAANRFDVVESKALPANLEDTQLIVFNNINFETMRPADKQRRGEFVQSGGGALWIAGEHNVYVDHKDQPEDPLARLFPPNWSPPRSPQGTAVVLIIDKSSSMEGKKIELARAAAEGVVDNLKPDDHVGVLIFDNSFMWDVPIRTADNKTLIKREISGIMPDGGTQIAPALTEAYQRILQVNSALQAHRAADGRHLGRRRQHWPCQAGARPTG